MYATLVKAQRVLSSHKVIIWVIFAWLIGYLFAYLLKGPANCLIPPAIPGLLQFSSEHTVIIKIDILNNEEEVKNCSTFQITLNELEDHGISMECGKSKLFL